MQHYVIQFVSDLRQVGSFLRVLRFPPPIKLHSDLLTLSVTNEGYFRNVSCALNLISTFVIVTNVDKFNVIMK
jgi:hypothetical protein